MTAPDQGGSGPCRSVIGRLRPEEAVGLLFLAVLVILSLVTSYTPDLRKMAVDRLVLVLLVVAAVLLVVERRASRAAATVRDWLPFALGLLIYENLHDVVPLVSPGVCDPHLIAIDRAILGGDAAVWAERFVSPALTRVMNFGYSTYYLIPPVFAGILYVRGDRQRFRHVMIGVIFGLYIGYIGYMLVPTIGPRYYQADLFHVTLEGDVFHAAVIARLTEAHGGTLSRDCFPSLHAASALTVLGFAIRYRSWWTLLFGPAVLLLLASTVYLRYHYVIDLVAGAVLAGFMLWAAPRVDRVWATWTRREAAP